MRAAIVKCPKCDGKPNVTDSRDHIENTRRRRYGCPCGAKFTTIEQLLHMGSRKGQHSIVSAHLDGSSGPLRARILAEVRERINQILDEVC